MLLAAVALSFAVASPAGAEGRRVALVIGNQAYEHLSSLSNPVLDAARMAEILADNGFDVHSCDGDRPGCFDLDREAMTDALEEFEDMAKGAAVAFVFYAGHGMQTRDGNVLAPVNMQLDCDSLDPRRAFLLDNVVDAAEGAAEKIVVIDACRNDPFQAQQCAARGGRPLSFDSIRLPAEAERFLLVSSTTPGQVARDGLPGAHSPFAASLFRAMEAEPKLRFDQLFARTAKDVIETTSAARATQVPETLTRGVAPESCLGGADCVADPLAALLRDEVAALRLKNARAQEYEEIVTTLLSQHGYASLDALPEAERASFLRGIVEAGRALAEQGRDGERALAALKRGDTQQAETLFRQEAARLDRAAEDERRKAAEAYRHLGALARVSNVALAAEHFAKAAERDPDDIQTWLDLGEALRDSGRTAEALDAFRSAALHARHTDDHVLRIKVAYRQGDILVDQREPQQAMALYMAARNDAEQQIRLEPDNLALQRELAVAYEKIGLVHHIGLDTEMDLAGVLEAYEASLAIRQRLVKVEPGNALWQSDLSASLDSLGSVKFDTHGYDDAREAFEASLAIRQRLAEADPGNASWQRDLSLSYILVGDSRTEDGDESGALDAYEASLAIRQRLTELDRGNAVWQKDLALSYDRIGDLRSRQSDRIGALEAYEASFAIMRRFAEADPDSTIRQLNLVYSFKKMASSTEPDLTVEYLTKGLELLEGPNAEGRLPPDEVEWMERIRNELDEARAIAKRQP